MTPGTQFPDTSEPEPHESDPYKNAKVDALFERPPFFHARMVERALFPAQNLNSSCGRIPLILSYLTPYPPARGGGNKGGEV
jgi:hypothetical protein